MADTKLSDLTALTSVAAGDLFYVVDISDTTDDAAGSSRKITRANLITAVANSFTLGQTIAQTAGTGTQISALTVTGAAHTALTASTENIGVNLNMSATKEFATGALTTQREVVIQGPTYGFVGASTITDAVTLYVKEPTAGTNATITRKAAILVEGKLVVQQPGGTPGTDQVEISHSGSVTTIESKDGGVTFRVPYSATIKLGSNDSASVEVTQMYISSLYANSNFNIGVLESVGVKLRRGKLLGFTAAEVYNTPDVAFYSPSAGMVTLTNGTDGQWAPLTVGNRDAGTNTITNGLTLGHQSSGTPAAGLGEAILFTLNSSTTADQNAAQFYSSWNVATHASRTSQAGVYVVTNAGALAEVVRFDGGGGASPSAGNTGLMLYDVDNATLERVTVGAADSGGSGFKVLRIPN